MTGFVNPLDVLGLSRSLVGEIWNSRRTEEQKVELLLEIAKASVRGISKVVHPDKIAATGKEPLDHYTAMTEALSLFEDKVSIPAFVEFWLDPEETLKTRMYNQAQAAAKVRERRISALYEILGSIDRRAIKGVEGDFEAALFPGVNGQYAAGSPFLDNATRGDTQVLKAYGDEVKLWRVAASQEASDAIPLVQLHEGEWKTVLPGGALEPARLLNPIAVRIVGGLASHAVLEAQNRGDDPYRVPVAAYLKAESFGAAADEKRQAAIDSTYALNDFRWRKPEDQWWLEALCAEVDQSDYGHIVLARENKDGQTTFAAFGIRAFQDCSLLQ